MVLVGPDTLHSFRAGLREDHSPMMHVTCDLCGKDLVPGDEQRYVVKIEVLAPHGPGGLTDEDLEEDHMQTLSQILREEEDDFVNAGGETQAPRSLRYDLCSACRK